jgi:hypothetical protein
MRCGRARLGTAGTPRTMRCHEPGRPGQGAKPRASAMHCRAALETIRQRQEHLLLKGACSESVHHRARHRSQSDGPPQAARHDLGDPRPVVGADPPDPQGVLAPQAHRTPAGPLEEDPQRDHLPLAERLPVGPTPRAVRPQEYGPRLVPAVGGRGRAGEDLGGAGRRVRRTRGGRVEVAECRRDAGQGPVRGGKRRARTPPTAGKWGRRRAC